MKNLKISFCWYLNVITQLLVINFNPLSFPELIKLSSRNIKRLSQLSTLTNVIYIAYSTFSSTYKNSLMNERNTSIYLAGEFSFEISAC